MDSGLASESVPRGKTMRLRSWAHGLWGSSYDAMMMGSWGLELGLRCYNQRLMGSGGFVKIP